MLDFMPMIRVLFGMVVDQVPATQSGGVRKGERGGGESASFQTAPMLGQYEWNGKSWGS